MSGYSVKSISCNKIVPFIILLTACLLVGIGFGQDWLEGGFVRSGDYGDIRQYFTDPIFYSSGSNYASSGLAISGMDRTKNVALLGSLAKQARRATSNTETMDHARTKWSFRSYPKSSNLNPSLHLEPIIGDTPVTLVSQGMRGYQVFLDGTFIGTEGKGGDPLDGNFSFNVIGNQNHEIRVYDGQFNYSKTMYLQKSVPKIIYVEPGTTVHI
jgi:hypothetical protein